jgi:hypothetical protein
MFKGILELEIDGRKRGFKFGMASLAKFCEFEGIAWFKLEDVLKAGQVSTIINFFYAGALIYAERNKLEIDFDYGTVADWLDEVGVAKAAEEMYKAFAAYSEKNSVAPTMN